MKKDPFAVYKVLREQRPVCRVNPGNHWALSRYEDVHFALTNPQIFSSTGVENVLLPDWLKGSYVPGNGMVFADKPEHTHHRKLVADFFSRQCIDKSSSLMRNAASALIDQLSTGKAIDFYNEFAYPYAEAIMHQTIGIDLACDGTHWRQLSTMIECPPPEHDANYLSQKEAVYKQCQRQLLAALKENWCLSNPSLMGSLKDVDDTTSLELMELIILGGVHPVVHLLGHAIVALVHNPKLLKAIRDDATLLPLFVDELVRRNSQFHLTARRTLSPITLSGIEIPADTRVILILASANRDPAQFPAPNEFDLHRSNLKRHVGFGAGVHLCLGIWLTRIQVIMALEEMLAAFSSISCPPPGELDWVYTLGVHSVYDLPVTLKK